MNRYFLVLATIFSALLTGCASDYTMTYDSASKHTYDSSDDDAAAKNPDRIIELWSAAEADMLSASYAAIMDRFPTEEVNRLPAPQTGYAWSREVQDRDFKIILSRCSGEGSNKERVTGWLYKIQSRSAHRQSETPVSKLASSMADALARLKVHAFLVTGVTCGVGADETGAAKNKASGTGFFVSSDGYIITNNHVVADASHIDVHAAGGKVYVAKVIGTDPHNDVALLKVDAEAVPLPISPTSAVEKGAEVFTLGFPLPDLEGNELKATFGRVNALSGLEGDIRFLQIDVPIQPGNSGGPLIANDGSVIGITTKVLSARAVLKERGIVPQNVNYAVKSEYIMPLLQYAHVKRDAGKLTTGAIKDPSQFERSIVYIEVEIDRKSARMDK